MDNENYEYEFYKRDVMREFLETVTLNETEILQLLEILKSQDTAKFLELTLRMEFEGFTMEDFLYYWSTIEYGMTLSGASCVYRITEILDRYFVEGRTEDALGLLRGDPDIYEKVRQEVPILRNDIFADYNWFSTYIERHFSLRYMFKLNGVQFPEEEDEEEVE